MSLSHVNNIALAGLISFNGVALSGLSEILGQATTPPSGITWTGTLNMNTTGSSAVANATASDGDSNTTDVISSGGTGYFEFNSTPTIPAYYSVALRPVSGSPYAHSNPISSPRFRIQPSDTAWYTTAGAYVADTTINATDVWQIGFDGAHHVVYRKNGSIVHTTTGTVTPGDYVLYVFRSDAVANGSGIENVTVVP